MIFLSFVTLVFTAGIGENCGLIRKKVCESLRCIGVRLDPEANEKDPGEHLKISADDSMIDVYVIPANEELMIAKDTKTILEKVR